MVQWTKEQDLNLENLSSMPGTHMASKVAFWLPYMHHYIFPPINSKKKVIQICALLVFLICHLFYLFTSISEFSTKYFLHSSKYRRGHMSISFSGICCSRLMCFNSLLSSGHACMSRCRTTWLWKKGLWAIAWPGLQCNLPTANLTKIWSLHLSSHETMNEIKPSTFE